MSAPVRLRHLVRPADAIAHAILQGFDRHYRLFRETSAAAKARWEKNEWTEVRDASRSRIDMYDQRVAEAVETITRQFAEVARDESLWSSIKRAYIGLLHEHKQPECAETFYNSVARRVLDRRYYRNEYIFSRPAISTEHLDGDEPTYRCYYPPPATEESERSALGRWERTRPEPDKGVGTELRETFREVISAFGLESEFQDLERDLTYITRAIAEHFPRGWVRDPNFQMHVLRSPFFRNKGAYVVGRVVNGDVITPFVLPLLKDEEGKVFVDTILLDKKNLGRVMSLGRTYFFVDMEVPAAYVDFLLTVVPSKTKTELYTLLGLQKQGKTLFFRDLEHHLKHSTDKFVLAPGTKGMVMLVFTLPSFPYVFKVIRDWFAPPKDADRALVEDRYRFVKLNDRVGRMSDTLEYAHVAFPRERFDDALLAELERLAPSCVERDGERIVIKHFYIEGRLTPLDVYVREADLPRALEAVNEYGNAIKELAGANMFPGDLLLKNFGLTRFGRVVFYDYDELCQVTECRFRKIPRAQTDEDEYRAEPFFNVEPADIFPEQFPTFLFADGPLRRAFVETHGELTDPVWWNGQKERLFAGIVQDLFAYSHAVRFCQRYGGEESQPPKRGDVPETARDQRVEEG